MQMESALGQLQYRLNVFAMKVFRGRYDYTG
jgi:hypothetical protein